jgi:lipooligosaccharide transport system permease protein
MAHPTLAVLERNLLLYRRLWRASALSNFALPLMFLLSIGIGVGGRVGEIDGVRYLSWIVPGVLASTAFQLALGECTYSVLGGFMWIRSHHAMYAAPVRVRDMIGGWLLYVLFRVELAVLAFLLVTVPFGVVRSPWALATPLVCAVLTVAVAAPTTAFAASIESDGYFALLFRFVMIPSTLFAGVFFPVARLPAVVRPVAYASPLWHAVELDRAAMLGSTPPWPVAAHVGYLLAWAAVGTAWALRAFHRRLRD